MPSVRHFFAITLDPLIRRYLCTITLASSKLRAFADDVGLALLWLAAQLGAVVFLFTQWARASAFRLNPAKCVIIPAGDVEQAKGALGFFPELAARSRSMARTLE